MKDNGKKKYMVADMEKIAPQLCSCGETRRAFTEADNSTASFHIVEVSSKSRPHYHQKTTEIYYVLEGEGVLELDEDRIELKPGTAVLIEPGCVHRAVGRLRIINVPIPAFDPSDEWFPKED